MAPALDLADLPPREREDRMLRALAVIACGRLKASEGGIDDDLRQLGYLAALGRGRFHTPEMEEAVDGFARSAHAALSDQEAAGAGSGTGF